MDLTKKEKELIVNYWSYASNAYGNMELFDHVLFLQSDVIGIKETESDLIISICGSNDNDDWKCNLSAFRKHESGFPVGIYNIADGVFDTIKNKLDTHKRVIVVGHSRGGWIAAAIGRKLTDNSIVPTYVGCYASPQQAYKEQDIPNLYSIYNKHDTLRNLVALSLLGYKTQGKVVDLPSPDWRSKNRLRGLLPWKGIQDHRPWAYDDAIIEFAKTI